MDALKNLSTKYLNLNFDDDRHIFHNTDHWAIAPQPKGILYPEYYDILVNWRTPLTVAALYVLMVVLLNPKEGKVSRVVAADNAQQELSQSSPFMTTLVFVHNAILCIYSGWTFYGMFFAWKEVFTTHSFMDAVCDTDGTFWGTLGFYSYYFYLSKYYEILDTIIILLKGRRSSLLQTYHHAGAIITMYLGYNYRAHPIWIFTTFNSFVHTIMYAYYAATSVGLKPPGKKYLTSMQITQFWTGSALALWYEIGAPEGCFSNPGSRFAIWANLSYVFPLTFLFLAFARKMYGDRGKKTKVINKTAQFKKEN
ncbi:ELO family [Lobosporangium transversale]|uniref:Elongation of fatty acids protein n=1 Tax=Lobosporangium transversale TaxID=64571 RepID=A0A1Y2GXP6_9FUNG|nr:ELO family [Lobosporangium transversale]ORZ27060.1 ELO family [Lobosporangium transversale]|eukprot:XP_021884807.1 ELO family [Lobosporangium transversale]